MNFISLNDTLQGMNSENLPEAAGALHQALNNFDETRPRWAVINKDSLKPLFNDDVSSEGMEILLHAAGSERRRLEYFTTQRIAFQQAGMDYSDTDLSENMSNLLYPRDKFTRPLSIGFNRNELIAFLNDNGIQHTLAPRDTAELVADTDASNRLNNKDKQGNTGANVYTQRKISFDAWIAKSGFNINSPLITKKTIFEQIQRGCKPEDKSLWTIKFSAFNRDFWPQYSKENGIKRPPGKPKSKF